MKLVSAIIQPYMFDKLSRALRKQKLTQFTMCAVKSYGVPDGESSIDLMSDKVRIDLFVHDDQAIEVSELIAKTVGTHQEGDGLIFVSELTHVINIDTDKYDSQAFS
ncbi:P-II family nitrogen regulator [Candidatus Obscuribacterales bacterium]|nr:P-II family nitrogen regulator [Candidatus Obscuribacterales bacterium]